MHRSNAGRAIPVRARRCSTRPADPAARRPAPPVATVQDTTTCLVADKLGNVVAATPSGWSGVVAGDTGVWLGSRLQSFNTWEGHPDVIEPGKRPRITLSPTIVLDNNEKPVLAISVAGGDNQDQMILQLLVDFIDFERRTGPVYPRRHRPAVHDATTSSVRSDRSHPALGQLRINPELGQETLDALKKLGHKLVVRPGPLSAAPSVIQIRPGNPSQFNASGDPRAGRHAMAY